jgi:hypothetical protein
MLLKRFETAGILMTILKNLSKLALEESWEFWEVGAAFRSGATTKVFELS